MKVCAAPGLQVPKEDSPRQYITQDEACEVPESYYYLRRVSDGDLVIVGDAGVENGADKSAVKKSASKNV